MPVSFSNENAGALTYQRFPSGRRISVMPWSRKLWPSITFVAMRTRLQSVDFERNGTLREARGLTSIT